MLAIKIRTTPNVWAKQKPESIKSKEIEDALKKFQKIQDDYNKALSRERGVELKGSLNELSKVVERVRKGVDRKDKDAHGALDEVLGEVEALRKQLEGMIAKAEESASSEEEGEDPDAEVSDHKLIDPDRVKANLKRLASGPLPFAFGYDDAGDPVLVVAKGKNPKTLAAILKSKADVAKPTFGTAMDQKGELTLELEGPKVTGMSRGLTRYLKDNKPMPYSKATILQDGAAVADEEDGGAEQENDRLGGRPIAADTATETGDINPFPEEESEESEDTEGTSIGQFRSTLEDYLMDRVADETLDPVEPGSLSALLKDFLKDTQFDHKKLPKDELASILQDVLGKLKSGANPAPDQIDPDLKKGNGGNKGTPGGGGEPGASADKIEAEIKSAGLKTYFWKSQLLEDLEELDPKLDALENTRIPAVVDKAGKSRALVKRDLAEYDRLKDVDSTAGQAYRASPSDSTRADFQKSHAAVEAHFEVTKSRMQQVATWADAEAARLGNVTPEPSGDNPVPPAPAPAPSPTPGPNAGPNPGPNPTPGPGPNPAPAPAPAPQGALSISGSVGKGGKNKAADVTAVQNALNGQGAQLEADGKCGPKTIKAIMDFQKQKGWATPDGLVEPSGFTLRSLNGESVPPPQPKPKGQPAPAKGGGGNPVQGKTHPAEDPNAGGAKPTAGGIAKTITKVIVDAKKIAEQKMNEALTALAEAKKSQDEARRRQAEELVKLLEEKLKTGAGMAKKAAQAVETYVKQKSDQAERELNTISESVKKHYDSATQGAQEAWDWLKSQDFSSAGKPLTPKTDDPSGDAGGGIFDTIRNAAKSVSDAVGGAVDAAGERANTPPTGLLSDEEIERINTSAREKQDEVPTGLLSDEEIQRINEGRNG